MNNKLKKILIFYILLIILISAGFIFYNINKNQKDNNTADNTDYSDIDTTDTAPESTKPQNPLDQGSELDPVSGEYFNKNLTIRSIPADKNVDSIFFLGQSVIFDKTSIGGDRLFKLKTLYNKLAVEKGHTPANQLDIRVYKDFNIDYVQTNDSITYTFKTYIDGEDYYSAFTYDINDKVNLKILTEDKSKVLHEYSN